MAGRGVRIAVLAAAVAGARRVARHSGVTAAEAHAALPGDGVVPHSVIEWTRGITIHRPAAEIWPWLVQMGYGRAGWYTPEAFDRWAARWIWRQPDYRPSPWQLMPEYQRLSAGDLIPDGPDHEAYFRVVDVAPARHLVLWSLRHPWRPHPVDATDPEAVRRIEDQVRAGPAWLEFTWSFVLRPADAAGANTRLLVRCRANLAPRVMRALSVPLGLYDWYETGGMLRGIRTRVERAHYRAIAAAAADVPDVTEQDRVPA